MNSPKILSKMSAKEPKSCAPAAVAAHAAVAEGGMAEAVIGGALLRVLQALIGFAERLELRFGIGAAAIAVRMAFHRELAIGGLDRRRIGRPLHLQQRVIIGLNHDDPDGPPVKPAKRPIPLPADDAEWTGAHHAAQPLLSSSTSENSASTTSSSPAPAASPSGASAPGEAAACWSFS